MRGSVLLWLLLLVPLALTLGTQQLLRNVYGRYRAIRNHAGITGAEAARALLDAHQLQRRHPVDRRDAERQLRR